MNQTIPTVVLNDGVEVPVIGFGTGQIKGEAAVSSVSSALSIGYRLLDTAFNYENEGAVGAGIRASGVPREHIVVTSKLPGRHHAYKNALEAIEESLYRMGLSYCDLYLIHWPNPKRDLYVEAWQALIEARRRGLLRSIGVSNFLPEHLERIIKETGVTPSVNQIELHPRFTQEAQRAFHSKHGIVTESWSPLGGQAAITQEPIFASLGEKYGKSPQQVILRWHYQQHLLPIPKASSVERQKQNIDIFDFTLSVEDVDAISKLTRADGRVTGQDPSTHEEL